MFVRGLKRVDRVLGAVEKGGVVAALALILLLSLYEIVARNLGIHAPPWVDPLRRQLVLWGGLLGAVLAVRAQAHIRFDFIQPRLSGRFAVAARWVVSGAGTVVCFFLARGSLVFVQTERGGVSTVAGVPAWIFASIIPVAFFLMAIHFVLEPAISALGREGARKATEAS